MVQKVGTVSSMTSVLDQIEIVRLDEDTELFSFDCGDMDLNDFLLNDAKNYLKSMLAVTYLVKVEDEIVAYFCLSYDGLTRTTILTEEEKALWNRVGRKIPNSKRRKTYPAVKIGRLAVAEKYAGFGIGRRIIDAIAVMYLCEQHHAACRFVTVDAYRSALSFYERNDFRYLTTKDGEDDTRAMYFDLKAI
ncbi:MAG: GNAT family N-acetyltransferase [Clostridiales Family XIII bacterium]|jgi:GNAT superfamily N-acetyltransferase|nr:GNAT family N-acetyltransferase [Clostridiales Family XIII bacterium]